MIKSELLNKYPEIVFGMSPKHGLNREAPYFYNMSLSVGDDEKKVIENRKDFFNTLGLQYSDVALQRQIHSDIVTIVKNGGKYGESDAMITAVPGIGLAISVADCTPVFIYDPVKKVISGIHSGWRGTEQKIVLKTIDILKQKFRCIPQNLIVYIGPSISKKNYEVGNEVAAKFEAKYSSVINDKLCLDVSQANYDMLLEAGIPKNQIELSYLCSFENKELLHSYRRDGALSGRSFGLIAMRKF